MSDNVCSICLETLLPITEGKEVGATVPCGHCFHLVSVAATAAAAAAMEIPL